MPDRTVGESEDPGGEVPGDGGVAHVGDPGESSTGLLLSDLERDVIEDSKLKQDTPGMKCSEERRIRGRLSPICLSHHALWAQIN